MTIDRFSSHLGDGRQALDALWPLLAVPAVVSVLKVDDIRATLAFDGMHFGISFVLPVPIGDLWVFVDPPPRGSGIEASGMIAPTVGATIGTALIGIVAFLVIYAVLTAGYLGSIHQYRQQGHYDFFENVGRYSIPYLGVAVVFFGAMFLAIAPVLASPGFIVFSILLVLAIMYLLWGAWFAVPVDGLGAGAAIATSVGLAMDGGDYVGWSLVHLAIGLGASLALTAVVANTGIAGIVLGIAVAAPLGFVLTYASLAVVEGLLDQRHASPAPA